MCARYTQIRDLRAIIALVTCQGGMAAWVPRYNIAPRQQAPVIVQVEGQRRLKMLRWGLVPSWADDEAVGAKLINARAESLAEKPSFCQALARRRCLIPADGFYEWETTPAGKVPWRFTLKDESPFCFAGLWEQWQPKARSAVQGDFFAGGEASATAAGPLETFTVITTGANDLVRPLHDRMPVMFSGPEMLRWLDPAAGRGALMALLRPYPADAMARWPASPRVNHPRNEGIECLG
jgi:putative SOS response-associated peptidase YedK